MAVVERSPAAVAAHDRAAWLALFSDDAVVEDPVGAPPAPKRDGTLGRFYDAFIAPHEIHFEIRGDHVLGDDVFRDAVIHTTVRRGVNVDVPAYLLYQVADRGGALFARRMAAHWQLSGMVGLAVRLGPRAWVAMTVLFAGMVQHLGVGWVAGYLASLWRTVGRRGTALAAGLADALARRDAAALGQLFEPGAVIELGERSASPGSLLDVLPPGTTLGLESPVTAGWTVSFRFTLEGATPARGLALLEVSEKSGRLTRARFFPA